MTERNFASIESAIEKIAAGGMVIVVDDEARENEGDFICAAEKITPEMVNFMLRSGRGVLCVPMPRDRADTLQLEPASLENSALHHTNFTVSVDVACAIVRTGVPIVGDLVTIPVSVKSITDVVAVDVVGHVCGV